MDKEFIEVLLMDNIIKVKPKEKLISLTDLGKIYNIEKVKNKWTNKDIYKFFRNKKSKDYIMELIVEEDKLDSIGLKKFYSIIRYEGYLKALKHLGKYKVEGKADNKSVYCDPFIFTAVAKWLNPEFESVVETWLIKKMIVTIADFEKYYTNLKRRLKH